MRLAATVALALRPHRSSCSIYIFFLRDFAVSIETDTFDPVIQTIMAEPQPPNVQEGMDPEGPPPPASAEDRKAAAAMSTLERRGGDEEVKPNKQIDQEALGKAISRLELADKVGKIAAGEKGQGDKEKEEREKRAKIKVDQADVALLVDELDLNKIKATDLLKAHDGDAVKAMTAFVRAVG